MEALERPSKDKVRAGRNGQHAERRHHSVRCVAGTTQTRIDQRYARASERREKQENDAKAGLNFSHFKKPAFRSAKVM